jgi:hypothetical protein
LAINSQIKLHSMDLQISPNKVITACTKKWVAMLGFEPRTATQLFYYNIITYFWLVCNV